MFTSPVSVDSTSEAFHLFYRVYLVSETVCPEENRQTAFYSPMKLYNLYKGRMTFVESSTKAGWQQNSVYWGLGGPDPRIKGFEYFWSFLRLQNKSSKMWILICAAVLFAQVGFDSRAKSKDLALGGDFFLVGWVRDLALGGDYWATEHSPSIWMHLSHPYFLFTLSIISILSFEQFKTLWTWIFFLFIQNFTFESKTSSADFELMHPWQEKGPGRGEGGYGGGRQGGRKGKVSCPTGNASGEYSFLPTFIWEYMHLRPIRANIENTRF